MPVVGTLTVDLVANTATFQGDLGKAAQSAREFGKSGAQAGTDFNFSMREARGSLMLMENEMGVRLPREMNTLIASIPGIGLAFEALLPIMGAVFAVEMISKWYEAHKKAVQELSKDELAVYDSATKGAEKFLKSQESSIKAAYALAIAQASGDPVRQAQLRVDEARAVGTAQGQNMAQLVAEREVQRDLVAGETKKAQQIKDSAGRNTRTGQKYTVDTSDEDAKAQAGRDKINAINDLIMAMRQHEQENQAQVITGTYAVGKLQEGIARTDAKDKEKAYDDWLKRNAKVFADYDKEKQKIVERKNASEAEQEEIATMSASVNKQRVRQEDDLAKLREKLADESLKDAFAASHLKLAAGEEAAKHALAMGQSTRQQELQAELKAAQASTKAESDALKARISALDKGDKDYIAKLKEFEDKKREIEQQGAQQAKAIQNQAAEDVHKSEQSMRDEFARTAAQSIVQGHNMLAAFRQVGTQMAEAALENMMKQNAAQDVQQLKDAGHAASATYAHVMETVPPPFGFPLALAEGAAAFAGTMSFHGGGEIPGYGDVPIMAQGGETVVTRQLTEQVRNNRGGGGGGGHTIHISFGDVQALDAAGVDGVLKKHAALIQKHVTAQLRRMNK